MVGARNKGSTSFTLVPSSLVSTWHRKALPHMVFAQAIRVTLRECKLDKARRVSMQRRPTAALSGQHRNLARVYSTDRGHSNPHACTKEAQQTQMLTLGAPAAAGQSGSAFVGGSGGRRRRHSRQHCAGCLGRHSAAPGTGLAAAWEGSRPGWAPGLCPALPEPLKTARCPFSLHAACFTPLEPVGRRTAASV